MADRPPSSLANLAPPFGEGNKAAVKHGIYSEEGRRAVDAVVAPYVERLAVVAPWVTAPAFAAELRAWAMAEAIAEAFRQHLAQHGFVDGKGKPVAGLEGLRRIEVRAERLRQNLLLSPKAYAAAASTLVEQAGGGDAAERIKAAARQMRDAVGEGPGE